MVVWAVVLMMVVMLGILVLVVVTVICGGRVVRWWLWGMAVFDGAFGWLCVWVVVVGSKS